MEKKKRNIKNRICAGLLALTLSGMPTTLVKAEEQIVMEEQAIQIVNQAEALEDLIRHPRLYKYVSEDGSKFKWICSMEPEIDGLKWTEETMDFDFSFESSDYIEHLNSYECPVEEYHQHLYGYSFYGMGEITKDLETYLVLKVVAKDDKEYATKITSDDSFCVKTPVIVTYSEQDYQIMKNLQLTPTFLNCMVLDLFEQRVVSGSSSDFKLLVLSVKDDGDYYTVDEKLISRNELAINANDYPYMPNALDISDTYQPKTDYKVYKKTK